MLTDSEPQQFMNLPGSTANVDSLATSSPIRLSSAESRSPVNQNDFPVGQSPNVIGRKSPTVASSTNRKNTVKLSVRQQFQQDAYEGQRYINGTYYDSFEVQQDGELLTNYRLKKDDHKNIVAPRNSMIKNMKNLKVSLNSDKSKQQSNFKSDPEADDSNRVMQTSVSWYVFVITVLASILTVLLLISNYLRFLHPTQNENFNGTVGMNINIWLMLPGCIIIAYVILTAYTHANYQFGFSKKMIAWFFRRYIGPVCILFWFTWTTSWIVPKSGANGQGDYISNEVDSQKTWQLVRFLICTVCAIFLTSPNLEFSRLILNHQDEFYEAGTPWNETFKDWWTNDAERKKTLYGALVIGIVPGCLIAFQVYPGLDRQIFPNTGALDYVQSIIRIGFLQFAKRGYVASSELLGDYVHSPASCHWIPVMAGAGVAVMTAFYYVNCTSPFDVVIALIVDWLTFIMRVTHYGGMHGLIKFQPRSDDMILIKLFSFSFHKADVNVYGTDTGDTSSLSFLEQRDLHERELKEYLSSLTWVERLFHENLQWYRLPPIGGVNSTTYHLWILCTGNITLSAVYLSFLMMWGVRCFLAVMDWRLSDDLDALKDKDEPPNMIYYMRIEPYLFPLGWESVLYVAIAYVNELVQDFLLHRFMWKYCPDCTFSRYLGHKNWEGLGLLILWFFNQYIILLGFIVILISWDGNTCRKKVNLKKSL